MLNRVYILGLILIFLIGCATTSGNRNSFSESSWKGSHKTKLNQKWGPPTLVDTDEADGEIWFYDFDITGEKITKLVDKTSSVSVRAFWVDKNGIIYRWMASTNFPVRGGKIGELVEPKDWP